jgi:hypothetical protein
VRPATLLRRLVGRVTSRGGGKKEYCNAIEKAVKVNCCMKFTATIQGKVDAVRLF